MALRKMTMATVSKVEVTMRYPEWCSVTVYRLIGEQRVAFTEQLFWDECYQRSSYGSEVPNARWQLAPRQMLHKCTKAAVLRAAFPEEGVGPTAEEMEDGVTDDGGFIIEGQAEPSPPSDLDRQADQAYQSSRPPDGAVAGPADLDEQNGTKWLANCLRLLQDRHGGAASNRHPRPPSRGAGAGESSADDPRADSGCSPRGP